MTLLHCVGPVRLAFLFQWARAGFGRQKLDGSSIPKKQGAVGSLSQILSFFYTTLYSRYYIYHSALSGAIVLRHSSIAAQHIWALCGAQFPIWEYTRKFPKSNIVSLKIQEIITVIQKSCIKTAGP